MKGCSASSSCLESPAPCLLRPLVFWDFRRKESLVLRTFSERLLQWASTLSFGDDSWDPDCFPFEIVNRMHAWSLELLVAKPRLLRRVGDDSARSFAVCADHVHFPLFVVSCSPNLVPNSPLGCRGERFLRCKDEQKLKSSWH